MNKIIATITLSLISSVLISQNYVGNWEGALEIRGTELPIIFHISKTNESLSASFDSPSQKAYNIACSDAFVKNDSLILLMAKINGRFAGKLDADQKTLSGTWYQSGYEFPLSMLKTSDMVSSNQPKRPQTPQPPFPYKSEEVEYTNADKSIKFSASFTVPLPDPNVDYFRAPIYPVVILISGSGPQDRDETIFNHKPFAVIADYLTKNGVAVLRYDKRGVGKSTGSFMNATSADFAKDVEAGIEYLKTRDDIDFNSIGLIGHSEGGLIAPMIAASRKDIGFIILLAGPGVKITELMEQQSDDVLAASGVSALDRATYRPLYKNLLTALLKESDSLKANKTAIAIFNKWSAGIEASTIKNTTGVIDEQSKAGFINAFVSQVKSPWFNYFLKINPVDYLTKVHCPVLALNGEKDIQVAPKQNLEGIKAVLAKTKNKNFKTIEMAGLNHLFQKCKACSIDEYAELEETFDIATLEIINQWIKLERFK